MVLVKVCLVKGRHRGGEGFRVWGLGFTNLG